MTHDMTNAFLAAQHIDCDMTDGIHRFKWNRPNKAGISVTIWIACQSPLMNVLIESTLPYMDACICLYHDHDATSCMRVRKAMQMLDTYSQNIFPMMTTIPPIIDKHKSRVVKFYNKDGFERTRHTGTLSETIETLLRVDLHIFKSLDRL